MNSNDNETRLRSIRVGLVFLLLSFFLVVAISGVAAGQNQASPAVIPTPTPTPTPSPSPLASPTPSLEKRFVVNVLKDQYGIWTSPIHLRKRDLRWLAPLGGAEAGFLATDEQTAGAIHSNPTILRISRGISNGGSSYSIVGAAATFYLVGRVTHDQRARETGILALEALIDTGIVTEVVKTVTQRSRPLAFGGEGGFFTHGSSFVSGHSSSIWSLAAVIDGEYGKRHPAVRYGIYGLATAVSLSRYTGRNHFLGDIVLGGALGWGVGHFVYVRHHDPNLDLPDNGRSTTKLEKYFPRIAPEYEPRSKTYGAMLAWNF